MKREQFISLVERYQRMLRRFLVALCCGDTYLADDIAQETFVKTFLSIDSCKGPDSFKAWIFRIGYNTFVTHRRRQHATVQLDHAASLISDSASDAGFRYQALYNALNLLSEKERTSLLLHYMEGYQINEIADIIKVSPDAIKQQLSRGRAHLQQLLTTNDSNCNTL